jgi:hypothetical protein
VAGSQGHGGSQAVRKAGRLRKRRAGIQAERQAGRKAGKWVSSR